MSAEPSTYIPRSLAPELAARAYARRRNLGLSRAQVSDRVGVSDRTLCSWENGKLPRSIISDRMRAWEKALALPAGALLVPQGDEPTIPALKRQQVTIVANTVSDAIRKVAICLATRGQSAAFPHRLIEAGAQRNADLFGRRYGVNGPEGTTLNELAVPFGITRERARQIIADLIERSSQFDFLIPILDTLQVACAIRLPCPMSLLNDHVRVQLGEHLTLEDACAFANDLLGKPIVRMIDPGAPQNGLRMDSWAYGTGENDFVQRDNLKAVRSVAYAMIRSCGVAHFATVAGAASLTHGLGSARIAKILQSAEGFEWLDTDRLWFWFGPEMPARNIILSVTRKVFSVARARVDIGDLLAAVMRARSRTGRTEFDRDRSLMLIPPIHIARAVLERLPWLHVVQHDDYRASAPLNPAVELSETELRLMAALEERDGVASRSELRVALPDINVGTLAFVLKTTPIVRLVSHSLYVIIGRPIDPTAFLRATATRDGIPNRIEVRRYSDGSVSFPHIITESAIQKKVCQIPTGAVPHVPAGEYRVRDSELTAVCVNHSSGAKMLNRLTQAMLAQGYDCGDVVRITIHPESRIIELASEDAMTVA